MAILDGEFIDDKDIDPAKHKFIGTFREPFSAYEDMAGEFHCRCGEHLFNQQSILDHWQKGHMDAPQYVSVRSKEKDRSKHTCVSELGRATCEEDEDGHFWLSIVSLLSKVDYCPYCGKKAPRQVGE